MKKSILVLLALALVISCEKAETEVTETKNDQDVESAVNGEALTQEQIDRIVAVLDAHEGETGIAEIKMLVTGGDIINARHSYKTALMWASEYGYTITTSLLIEAGSDIHAVNKDGETALNLAEKNGHNTIANMLKEAGLLE